MGLSMGGLILFYVVIEYQEVFSKVGVFFVFFWFVEVCYDYVSSQGKQEDMCIYMIVGVQEGVNG